jgi:hypothetical protein
VICERCGKREASSNHVVGRIVNPSDDLRQGQSSGELLEQRLCDVCVTEVTTSIVDMVNDIKRQAGE